MGKLFKGVSSLIWDTLSMIYEKYSKNKWIFNFVFMIIVFYFAYTHIFNTNFPYKEEYLADSGLIIILPIIVGFFAIGVSIYYYKKVKRMHTEDLSDEMKEIADIIQQGAIVYLKKQYKVVSIFFIVMFIIFQILVFAGLDHPIKPFAFLTGGFFSALSGYLGMKIATYANVRTAYACKESIDKGLYVAMRAGSVMAFVVLGFIILDVSFWFLYLSLRFGVAFATEIIISFGIGASLVAMFARLGGGIYTKAADVGADLVGKIEADLPEDSPKNPASIADNVGDNVGDIAGMGADLLESLDASLLAALVTGVSAARALNLSPNLSFLLVIFPLIFISVGVIGSFIGIKFVRLPKFSKEQKILDSMEKGHWITIGINIFFIIVLSNIFLSRVFSGIGIEVIGNAGLEGGWQGLVFATVVGMFAGMFMSMATGKNTSAQEDVDEEIVKKMYKGKLNDYKPKGSVMKIFFSSIQGHASTILEGLATGFHAPFIPGIILGVSMILAYYFAGGFLYSPVLGMYGISLAAVGLFTTLGFTLTQDTYGPISDNAQGIAEMCDMGEEVKKRTEELDMVGNVTAANGKGDAIASAALTAFSLIIALVETSRTAILNLIDAGKISNLDIDMAKASYTEVLGFFNISFLDPISFACLLIGSVLAPKFTSIIIKAVSLSANKMVMEVRRQFDIIRKKQGTEKIDFDKVTVKDIDSNQCISIASTGALKEMIYPTVLAISTTLFIGALFHIRGVLPFLVGLLLSSINMALIASDSGGAWDNAKKVVESLKGKIPDYMYKKMHSALVTGDTVGDPLKDTSGPSMDILAKLSAMIAINFMPIFITLHYVLLPKIF